MSKVHENVIKKEKRKIKRVDVPKTIGDYLDNLTIDIKNLTNWTGKLEKDVEKVKWFGFQINENLTQIMKILRERNLTKSFREKEGI